MLDPTVLLLRTSQAHMIATMSIVAQYIEQKMEQRKIIERHSAAQYEWDRLMAIRGTQREDI